MTRAAIASILAALDAFEEHLVAASPLETRGDVRRLVDEARHQIWRVCVAGRHVEAYELALADVAAVKAAKAAKVAP